MKETDLYIPIKRFFESKGYEVKAEIKDCDAIAIKEDEEPIIIELKTGLTIDLLMQGVDRQLISDFVYLVVPHRGGRIFKKRLVGFIKLCKRLGLGLLSVRSVENSILVHCEPEEFKARKIKKRKTGLLNEFINRVGDPNIGGQSKRKIITAYRQDVLRILKYMELNHSTKPKDIKKELEIDNAPSILQLNYYGWFYRQKRGIYKISSQGEQALIDYKDYFDKLYEHHDFRPQMSTDGDNIMTTEPTKYDEVEYENSINREITNASTMDLKYKRMREFNNDADDIINEVDDTESIGTSMVANRGSERGTKTKPVVPVAPVVFSCC